MKLSAIVTALMCLGISSAANAYNCSWRIPPVGHKEHSNACAALTQDLCAQQLLKATCSCKGEEGTVNKSEQIYKCLDAYNEFVEVPEVKAQLAQLSNPGDRKNARSHETALNVLAKSKLSCRLILKDNKGADQDGSNFTSSKIATIERLQTLKRSCAGDSSAEQGAAGADAAAGVGAGTDTGGNR